MAWLIFLKKKMISSISVSQYRTPAQGKQQVYLSRVPALSDWPLLFKCSTGSPDPFLSCTEAAGRQEGERKSLSLVA